MASASAGRLDVPPALSEQELVEHLAELASRNVPTRASSSRSSGRASTTTYVPAVVDAVLSRWRAADRLHAVPARDEPGRVAGDLRVPDRDLRADRAWTFRTRQATTARRSRPTPATSPSTQPDVRAWCLPRLSIPQVRQVVKTYAPGFGLEVVEVPHRGGVTDRDRVRRGSPTTRPAPFFQQPNFFGCLEPAPDLAAAASGRRRACRSRMSTRRRSDLLEAPGNYGCAHRGRRRPARRQLPCRTAARTMDSWPLAPTLIRRMPGRIVG